MRKIVICLFFIFFSYSVYAMPQEEVLNSVADNADLNNYVKIINEEVKKNGLDEFDFKEISKDLLSKGKINNKFFFKKIFGLFFKELNSTIKYSIVILIIVLIISTLSSLELQKNSQVNSIAKMVGAIALSSIIVSNFIEIINMFKDTIISVSTLMHVISPFLMGILLLTGAISSTGIIEPMLLFFGNFIGFVISYVVVPLLSLSVAFSVVSNFSENVKLSKFSKLFNSTSMWIIGVIFAAFLGLLGLESSLSVSVDKLAVKTTQAAISNFIPVVGKFFSDSFEMVVGATKIISNTGGVIGVLAILTIASVPIFKVLCVVICYSILSAIIEPICNDSNVSKFISSMIGVYKSILGILIGVSILFIISTGIILNLIGQVIN